MFTFCSLFPPKNFKANGARLTAYSYGPVLKAAANVGDWQTAIACIDSMTRAVPTDKAAGPDLVCFNHAMAACAKAGKCEVSGKMGEGGGGFGLRSISAVCWRACLDDLVAGGGVGVCLEAANRSHFCALNTRSSFVFCHACVRFVAVVERAPDACVLVVRTQDSQV